jgi:hypothetical protein
VLHDGPLPGSKAGHDREARPDAQNAEMRKAGDHRARRAPSSKLRMQSSLQFQNLQRGKSGTISCFVPAQAP